MCPKSGKNINDIIDTFIVICCQLHTLYPMTPDDYVNVIFRQCSDPWYIIIKNLL